MTQKLSLPNVTLILIDTDSGELAKLALMDTLELIEPKNIIVLANEDFPAIPFQFTVIPKIKSSEEYGQILWHKIPPLIATSHMLIIQWDGWVINPSMWTEEFLSYDYIGAVWPWHQTNRIGNGGFSLRSTRLMKYMTRWVEEKYINPGKFEDDTLCRVYRGDLETFGFRWPNEGMVNTFSSEHQWFPSFSLPFGFHDCRNWPKILPREKLLERIELCEQNPYIRSKQEFKDLKQLTLYSLNVL